MAPSSSSRPAKGQENHNHRHRRRAQRSAKRDAEDGQIGQPSANGNSAGHVDGLPVASGSSLMAGENRLKATTADSGDTQNGHASAKATFDDGEEFIPFASSDESDDGVHTAIQNRDRDRKGKAREAEAGEVHSGSREEGLVREQGKDRERERERYRDRDGPSPPRERDRASERDGGREKRRADEDEDDRRSRRGGRRDRDRERDRDRGGNRDRDKERKHKRKHDEYDSDDGYSNKKQRLDASSRKCPWIGGLDLEKCQNVAEMMHREVESFVDWISPTPVEDEVRGLIVAQIAKVVTFAFPDAEVFPFGSYQTKLYLPLGDIDLVVLSDSMAYSDKSTVLHVLASTLKRNGITSHVTIIAKAKVPIVKFVTAHGRFKVDISINQGNGLVSGKIITGFLRDMIPCGGGGKESKALRSLIMITKAFLSQRSMNEVYTGGLGSYGIVCLAVSFLQMHPKIRRGEIDPEKNLGVLVMEFFELYGHYFNYDEVGISLREGGTYFSKRQRGWHAGYKKNMLSVEDPADPSNDISSGSYNFHKVKTAFAGAHGILTSTAYLRAGMLSSRHHGRSVNLRGHYEPDDLSILSTVMGITQETINHRRLVQELYDRRVLHNLLGVKPYANIVNAPDVRREPGDDKKSRRESSSYSKSKDPRATQEMNDGDQSDDSDYKDYPRSRRQRASSDQEEEEGGRYDIGRQPPKKRRKTGKAGDAHTVYFVDDDDGSQSERSIEDNAKEDGEYMSDESVGLKILGAARSSNPKDDNKRSYWLSKGIGIGSSVENESA